MQKAIYYLEAELDSLQDAYESTKGTAKQDQYGIWVEEVENAIKLLKNSERSKNTETSDKHETEQLNILGVVRSLSYKKVTVEVDIETLKTLSDILTHTALRDNNIDWTKFQKLTRLSLDLILEYYKEV